MRLPKMLFWLAVLSLTAGIGCTTEQKGGNTEPRAANTEQRAANTEQRAVNAEPKTADNVAQQERAVPAAPLCAQQSLSGVVAKEYNTPADCAADKNTLAGAAAADATAKCNEFCKTTSCNAKTAPSPPVGVAGTCRGPINLKFYGDASAPIECMCTL